MESGGSLEALANVSFPPIPAIGSATAFDQNRHKRGAPVDPRSNRGGPSTLTFLAALPCYATALARYDGNHRSFP